MKWPDVHVRSLEPELMDHPGIEWDKHREALEGLERINFFSLAHEPIWEAVQEAAGSKKKLRILDIATGAGDLPMMLAGKARQSGCDFEIHGCDKSPQAVQYTKQKAESLGVKVNFFVLDIKKEKIPSGYDILINSLFLHHLTGDETIDFLNHLKSARPDAILINDLIRSKLGFFLAYAGTRLLSRSPVVHYDGPQSVKAAYTVSEISDLAQKTGFKNARIKKLWPERFLLTWKN